VTISLRFSAPKKPRFNITNLSYTSKKGNTFLNFGGKYPNQTFTGYLPAGSELAGDRWTVTLQGKVIGITGTVELYQGKPEIKVMSRSQIKGEHSQPVAQ
jgi:hypothetical protein